MAGYADRLLTLEFTDLTPDGDDVIYVAIRNPRIVPMSVLQGETDLAVNPETGMPLDPKAAERAMHATMAALIREWRVYDGLDESEAPEPLPLPATADLVAKLPAEIVNRIAKEIGEAVAPR